ncbi:alpha-(1,3)-fucosyltransferase C-like [Epargyreus clarus]|uniref:alpha-(1,3)-fucosyltransferase C-like n=1 Tax=Epargyreus clarus TaxID=520877 RepID=UPI003C2B4518
MSRSTKLIKILANVIYLIILGYLVIQRSHKTVMIKKIDRFLSDIKHILMWTKIPGLEDKGQRHFIDHKCTFLNCYVTTNRSLFGDLRYFDAILFNLQDISGDSVTLPVVRGVYQKYIFVANDSADNYPVCNPVYDNFFNWTWSYRYDSTITYKFITVYNANYENLGSHFQWIKNMTPIDLTLKTQFVTKSKAAAIFLDTCKSRSNREVFLSLLQKNLAKYNLSIDVFGDCGPLKCKRKTMFPCFWRLKKNYFFYMALEDSISMDFVTDVILYGYKYNAVPIVYGGAQYERFLPPNSYLNALNFTTEDLATHMNDIIRNRERYYDFFRWKNHYSIKESPVLDACGLCEKMNNPRWLVHIASYSQFRKWWNPAYEDRCMERYVIVL